MNTIHLIFMLYIMSWKVFSLLIHLNTQREICLQELLDS